MNRPTHGRTLKYFRKTQASGIKTNATYAGEQFGAGGILTILSKTALQMVAKKEFAVIFIVKAVQHKTKYACLVETLSGFIITCKSFQSPFTPFLNALIRTKYSLIGSNVEEMERVITFLGRLNFNVFVAKATGAVGGL